MKSSAPANTGVSAMFLRKNWQIFYAILLIILVPLVIIFNTLFVVHRFRSTVDAELQRTALLVGKLFNVAGEGKLDDPEATQALVERVAAELTEVKSLDVLKYDGKDFTVVASLYEDGIGRTAHGTQNMIAAYDGKAIAFLTKSPRSAAVDQQLTPEEARSSDRYWGVVMPLQAENGDTLLLSMKLSLKVIDDLIRSNLFWSYLWLVLTIVIVILILATNTRLFQYAALYRRLQEVDKMKDDFISMASHELRAPIAAVRGYISLFLDDAFGKLEAKPREIMHTTMAIATHLGVLVDDLLEVSRIEQGRMKVDMVPMNVEPLIEEVVNQLHFEAEKKKLAFTFTKPAEPMPQISADPLRLKQVLINLCSNAIKYTPSGSVTVTCELKDSTVEVRVIDTGLGMSSEAREKLFQKFFRVQTSDTATIPGTGLGLWITKQVVELMHGKIHCDSIERVGTQMSVLFPAIKPEEPNSPASP